MKRYLITGATGYIGSVLTERLLDQENVEVTVSVRDLGRLSDRIRGKVEVISADITDRETILQIESPYDYIIHCAAPTSSSYMVTHPVETAETIVDGTRNILELAKKCHVNSMVYLSSMEVYGNIDCSDGRRVTEEEFGELDISNVRSCYPMAKRMAESFCHLYYYEYGVPVKIARLAQTFGRGVLSNDHRVFAQFAQAVRDQTDIVLHTQGVSMGNYCEIDDAITAILLILEKGMVGEVYNVVNEENTMTIREMAEMVANKIGGGSIQVRIHPEDLSKTGYAPDTGLRLSAEKLRMLGWRPLKNLEQMYADVLKEMETFSD